MKLQGQTASSEAPASRKAEDFSRHESFAPRFGVVWSAACGQPGAAWRTPEEIAAFALKVGAPRPNHISEMNLGGATHFDGASSSVFAEMRYARADVHHLTMTRPSLESDNKRAGEPLAPTFLLRGLVPSEYCLWRGGILAQTSRFHVKAYAGRCPRPGEVPPQVLLEHWRWLTQRRGELAAYLRAPRPGQEANLAAAYDLPPEANASRQAALIAALLRDGADIAPEGELNIARLPSPPRAIAVDRAMPHRRLLIGELAGLLVVEFSPGAAASAASHADDAGAANARVIVALTLGQAFSGDLVRIARTFEHLTTHLLILRLASRLIEQLREIATADAGDAAAGRALWRGFLGTVESLWGWGECNDLHAPSFDAFDRAFRMSDRWSLILQRGGQLVALL